MESDIGKDAKLAILSGNCEYQVSAFSVAELGEMLKYHNTTYWFDEEKGWVAHCEIDTDGSGATIYEQSSFDSEADARAKLLIHLIENSLVSPSDEQGEGK